MTGFFSVANQTLKMMRQKLPTKQLVAILLLTTLLLPIGAPIPVWAYSLNIKPMVDDGLKLTAANPALALSATNFISDLMGGIGAFISPSVKSEKEAEKTFSKESLEKRVAGFETQIADKLKAGQVLSLSAMPVDKNHNPVNGLVAQWQSSNPDVLKIINDSQAIALKEGDATIIVSSGRLQKEFPVKVSDNSTSNGNLINRAKTNLSPMSLAVDDPPAPILSETMAESMVSPENNLGNPIGQTEMASLSVASAIRTRERAGSANYSFGIGVASLPGRGIDASMGITYNSRVWNKSGYGQTDIFDFNVDDNWLAPGFEIGYGEVEAYNTVYGNGVGYILTGPDGTRHQLLYKQIVSGCALYEATDGTFVQTTVCGYGPATLKVVYPDGSQVLYGATTPQGKRYPINITDRNGNMISIAYIAGDTVGKIAYIRDTLNRYITFHYDTTTEKKLVAVSVPGFNDSTTPRQTIRFYYEDMALQWQNRFEDTAEVNAPTSVRVLRYVYFPGTQTGYRYDYSPYFGMIYKMWQMRGMQVSTDALTQTGTVINEGTWAAWTQYNYAATAIDLGGIPLTDVPKYNRRTDDWQGRTTSTIPQTFFNTEEQTTPNPQGALVGNRVTKITAPDGTISTSISNIKPGEWDNGLLTETKVSTTENNQERDWSKTRLYWQQGDNQPQGRDNPRLQKIELTDDVGQTRATSFEYDGYNNQTVAREHNYAATGQLGTELRRVETTYETGAGWINLRQLRLPKTIKTIVNNIAVSKIVYEYDNNGASGATNLTGRADIDIDTHSRAYNPAYPRERICEDVDDPIPPDASAPEPIAGGQRCYYIGYYTGVTDFRGNVTKVTAFSDATLETDANAVISTMKYDIVGNEVEAGVSCCRLKVWEYVKANEYAYPMTETSGNEGQLTNSVTYDRNTGLVKTATDENNQTETFSYNPNNLRLIRADSPNGGLQTTEYNDTNYPFYVKSTNSLDATRSVSGWSFSNGRGQVFRARNQTNNGFISSDAEFDNVGRPIKSYNPYTVANLTDERPSGIKFSEITSRDGLGRTLATTLPDNTTVQAAYNGMTVTATDQAGKQRRQLADALGRITRVDEPDATGNLGDVNSPIQPTSYEYNGNDNLTRITQTGNGATQERLFKYDALSRLTHERQVEATATLNDLGNKVGTAGLWTGVYKYDNQSLLQEGVDARGVKTTFTYDGLNRIKTVVYANETGNQTPTVTYTYDEERPNYYNKGRLTKIQTAAVASQGTPETIQVYDFDKIGQVVNHTQSIGNQSYNLQYGYNLAGQLISEKYPSGKIVNMTVDNFGVLQTVSDSQRTYLNGISLNNQGLLSQLNLGNGTSETFSYNDRFQMTSQSLLKGAEVVQKYDYSFGQVDLASGNVDVSKNNGQLGKIESYIGTNKQWSQRFGYDSIGRLSEAAEYRGDNNSLTYKQKFDFDRFGNLYRKQSSNPTTGQANPLPYTPIEDSDISKATNRLTTSTTYDEAGQVITDNKFRNINFAYDANGRQVKASKANTPDALTVYDALGNRVATKIYDVWQYLIYDAFGKLVAEYGLQSEGLGGVKYIQQDWQGSPRTVTNNSGFVVGRTDHQAFGEEIQSGVGLRTTTQGFGGSANTRQGYGLTERDESSGQQHTGWRKLETKAGRWSSPDPYNGSLELGDPQSFNRYSYVGNEPTNYVDPSGLFREIEQPDYSALLSLILGAFVRDLYMPVLSDPGDGGGGPTVSPPPPSNNCGNNPINGNPGFSRTPKGTPGNLRPGVGGGGGYGDRRRNRGRVYSHTGVDISGISGESNVYAFYGGTVKSITGSASDTSGYGLTVTVDNGNGYTSSYSHLSSTVVGLAVGARVGVGNEISAVGTVGQSGNASGQSASEAHVHFEIRKNGTVLNPENFLNSPCPKDFKGK